MEEEGEDGRGVDWRTFRTMGRSCYDPQDRLKDGHWVYAQAYRAKGRTIDCEERMASKDTRMCGGDSEFNTLTLLPTSRTQSQMVLPLMHPTSSVPP